MPLGFIWLGPQGLGLQVEAQDPKPLNPKLKNPKPGHGILRLQVYGLMQGAGFPV